MPQYSKYNWSSDSQGPPFQTISKPFLNPHQGKGTPMKMCVHILVGFSCCDRLYLDVQRIATCNPDWPRTKCLPELCLQLGSEEKPQRRPGICWRCSTQEVIITGAEREILRPDWKETVSQAAPEVAHRLTMRKGEKGTWESARVSKTGGTAGKASGNGMICRVSRAKAVRLVNSLQRDVDDAILQPTRLENNPSHNFVPVEGQGIGGNIAQVPVHSPHQELFKNHHDKPDCTISDRTDNLEPIKCWLAEQKNGNVKEEAPTPFGNLPHYERAIDL